jgi:type III secretion protein J
MMKVDGVVSARVHIALPNNDPLSEKVTPPSAAVFIKYRVGYSIESSAMDLKNLVCKSIEGLKVENVELVLSPSEAMPPPPKVIATSTTDGYLSKLPPWGLPTATGVGGFMLAGVLFLVTRRRSPQK